MNETESFVEIAKESLTRFQTMLEFGEKVFLSIMDATGIDPVHFLFVAIAIILAAFSIIAKIAWLKWGMIGFIVIAALAMVV